MPQSVDHVLREDRLASLLDAWRKRTGADVLVGKELAFRWDEQQKRLGIDPDVYVVELPPERKEGKDVRSIRTWQPGHVPPLLAIEVVSRSRPWKDYSSSPPRHDLLGTFELWVFDPDLLGGTKDEPSVRFQMFQRETNARLVRTYAGDGPVFSDALSAWISVVKQEVGYDLVISYDHAGTDRWLTVEEEALERAEKERTEKELALKRVDHERAEKELALKRVDHERSEKELALKRVDDERAEKERALARLAELEAILASRSR